MVKGALLEGLCDATDVSSVGSRRDSWTASEASEQDAAMEQVVLKVGGGVKGAGFVCTEELIVAEVHAGKLAAAAGLTVGMQLVAFNRAELAAPADSWTTVKQAVRSTPKPWEFLFLPGPRSLPPPPPTWSGPPGAMSTTQHKFDTPVCTAASTGGTTASEPCGESSAPAPNVGSDLHGLTEDESEKLEDLRRQLADELSSASGSTLCKVLRSQDCLLLRFLRGTSFSVPHSKKVLARMLAWRRAERIDQLLTDPATIGLCERCDPFFIAGYYPQPTLTGQVLEIWRIGQIWPAEILEKFTQKDLEAIWFSHLERGLRAQGEIADSKCASRTL
eukprot:SAG31_NODE_6306_length_2073_cov_1.774569_1_plen_333_part_00